jgi:hypothetical protein
MNETITSEQHDLESSPWVVQFTEFRAIEGIDLRLQRSILDIWLKVVAPDARLIEPEGCPRKYAVFGRRDDLRKFLRAFGGRKLTKLPDRTASLN